MYYMKKLTCFESYGIIQKRKKHECLSVIGWLALYREDSCTVVHCWVKFLDSRIGRKF